MGRLVVRSRPEFSARSGGRLYARLKMVRFGQSLLHRAKTCCECVLLSKVGRQYFLQALFSASANSLIGLLPIYAMSQAKGLLLLCYCTYACVQTVPYGH